MISLLKKEDCCGCNACRSACPEGCIEMVQDSEGFLYPEVDKTACVNCGICESVCPMLNPNPGSDLPSAFAAWNNDASIRENSSSGGVFDLLMQNTLKQDGVVFGAAFDDKWTLCHQFSEDRIGCDKFRGSKYLQSIIGDAYLSAKYFLQQDRQVLFSGTPCQVAGLYSFLGRDYANLVTCDIVCHGVPSPNVFEAYRQMLEKKYRSKTKEISFRRKNSGWKNFSMSVIFENDRKYRHSFRNDPFMIGFLSNIYLRPSCHACRFHLPHVADLSLGDFWGVETHHPEWDDDRGTSLVLIRTEKGQKIINDCRDKMKICKADLDTAINANPCIRDSVAPGRKRDDFFCDFNKIAFKQVMKRYMAPPSFKKKAIGRVKRLVGHGLQTMQSLKYI